MLFCHYFSDTEAFGFVFCMRCDVIAAGEFVMWNWDLRTVSKVDDNAKIVY